MTLIEFITIHQFIRSMLYGNSEACFDYPDATILGVIPQGDIGGGLLSFDASSIANMSHAGKLAAGMPPQSCPSTYTLAHPHPHPHPHLHIIWIVLFHRIWLRYVGDY